jgi:hypothetical protein
MYVYQLLFKDHISRFSLRRNRKKTFFLACCLLRLYVRLLFPNFNEICFTECSQFKVVWSFFLYFSRTSLVICLFIPYFICIQAFLNTRFMFPVHPVAFYVFCILCIFSTWKSLKHLFLFCFRQRLFFLSLRYLI